MKLIYLLSAMLTFTSQVQAQMTIPGPARDSVIAQTSRKYLGTAFDIRGKSWRANGASSMKTLTGEPVYYFTPGSRWTCVKVVPATSDFMETALVLKGREGELIALPVRYTTDRKWVFPALISDINSKHYGEENWNLIIGRKLKLGMTAEMVEMAWGSPEHITKTESQFGLIELWVYDIHRALHFENGKLTIISTD